MGEKKISIIVPCYNCKDTIEKCVDSLMNQTLGSENIEIILVDDASTDDTWQYIQKIEQRYPENIIAIRYEDNGRAGRARNIGLQYASASYIGYADSDDWVEPDMFQILYEEAISYSADIVCCDYIRDDGSVAGNWDRGTGRIDRLLIDDDEKTREFFLSHCIGSGVWNKLFRAELIRQEDVYFPEKLAYEDMFFMGVLYFYAKRISLIDLKLYHYYINTASTVLANNGRHQLDILEINPMRYEHYYEMGLIEKYGDEIELDLLMSGYLAALKAMFLRFDRVPYKGYLRNIEYFNYQFPNISKNKYIDQYVPEMYRPLLGLLKLQLNEVEVEQVAEQFRRYFSHFHNNKII